MLNILEEVSVLLVFPLLSCNMLLEIKRPFRVAAFATIFLDVAFATIVTMTNGRACVQEGDFPPGHLL